MLSYELKSCYEKYVNELIQRSNVYLFFYDNFMFTSADESEALKGHARILALLKAGDVNGCVEAIERHNQVTLDQLSLNGIFKLQCLCFHNIKRQNV